MSGKGFCTSTSRPLVTSSYSRHASYADSNKPGPRAECTFIAHPMTIRDSSFSVTFAYLCENLRSLCVKILTHFQEPHGLSTYCRPKESHPILTLSSIAPFAFVWKSVERSI